MRKAVKADRRKVAEPNYDAANVGQAPQAKVYR